MPKDTKQLLANYKDVPENLIEAIVKSNDTRKEHIVNMIINKKPNIIGIYRLTMKTGSDNFRSSAVQDIIRGLKKQNIEIIIYEPTLSEDIFDKCQVIKDINEFKGKSDLIVANRLDDILEDVKEKIYTKDLYSRD